MKESTQNNKDFNPFESVGAIELISRCSYVENDHVYLEEDSDAYHFIDALKISGQEFNPKKI